MACSARNAAGSLPLLPAERPQQKYRPQADLLPVATRCRRRDRHGHLQRFAQAGATQGGALARYSRESVRRAAAPPTARRACRTPAGTAGCRAPGTPVRWPAGRHSGRDLRAQAGTSLVHLQTQLAHRPARQFQLVLLYVAAVDRQPVENPACQAAPGGLPARRSVLRTITAGQFHRDDGVGQRLLQGHPHPLQRQRQRQLPAVLAVPAWRPASGSTRSSAPARCSACCLAGGRLGGLPRLPRPARPDAGSGPGGREA